MKSEKDVKAKVKTILKNNGWFWIMPSANGFGTSGVSDFLAFKQGRVLAVETKFGSNKTSALQDRFLSTMALYGCYTSVVNEKNIDEFASRLSAMACSED